MSKYKIQNSGIYKITNQINNKCYIGSSVNCKYRIVRHKSDLISNKHHSQRLQNGVNKYGFENFRFEIVEEIEASGILRFFIDKLLIAREQYYIDKNLSFLPCHGYNIKRYAEHKKNKNMTEEEKENLRSLYKGKPLSKYHYQRMMEGMKTRKTHKPTKEEIENIIKSNRSRLFSRENRIKIGKKYAKLTNQQVIEINNSTLNLQEISKIFGVSTSTISNIRNNKSYLWVERDISVNSKPRNRIYERSKNCKFTDKQIVDILQLKLNNAEIAKIYNVDKSTIQEIRTRKRYKWVIVSFDD